MAKNLPTIGGLTKLLVHLKKQIHDDYRADYLESADSDVPSMCVTIGWDDKTGRWSYQTGDNSYMGSAYHYPHWAVITLDRRSSSSELAKDIRSQLTELVAN